MPMVVTLGFLDSLGLALLLLMSGMQETVTPSIESESASDFMINNHKI